MEQRRSNGRDGLFAGIDEAGRGSLAGPVVAAAVILPAAFDLPGLNDSKKLGAKTRLQLASAIKAYAVAWRVGVVWQERIDEINILQAALEAMARAASALRPEPGCLLVDGNQRIPARVLLEQWRRHGKKDPPDQEAIVHGDALIAQIAAASIIAKTFRDALMTRLARRWPGYGFAKHKGYGTQEHLAAIARLGPCPLHRRTFRGVCQNGE